jgi:hypothetical protein
MRPAPAPLAERESTRHLRLALRDLVRQLCESVSREMVLQARVRRLELELEERDRRSHVTH